MKQVLNTRRKSKKPKSFDSLWDVFKHAKRSGDAVFVRHSKKNLKAFLLAGSKRGA